MNDLVRIGGLRLFAMALTAGVYGGIIGPSPQHLKEQVSIEAKVARPILPTVELSYHNHNYIDPSFDAQAAQAPKELLQTAIGQMKHRGAHTALLHADGTLEQIISPQSDNPADFYQDAALIITPDSPLMEHYTSQVSPSFGRFLEDNISYAILHTSNPMLEGAMQGAAGRYFGNGVVAVNTTVHPSEQAGILIHEAEHGANEGEHNYRLQEERDAIAKQHEGLKTHRTPDTIVDHAISRTREAMETADFLLAQPGNPFRHVYPKGKILPCDLLEGQVDRETLETYAQKEYPLGDPNWIKGGTLATASKIALISMDQDQEGLASYVADRGNDYYSRAMALHTLEGSCEGQDLAFLGHSDLRLMPVRREVRAMDSPRRREGN